MKNALNIIDNSGWTGIIVFGLVLVSVILLIELHSKKQDRLFIGNQWVENDYYPLPGRIVIAIFTFLFCIALFFTLKHFVL